MEGISEIIYLFCLALVKLGKSVSEGPRLSRFIRVLIGSNVEGRPFLPGNSLKRMTPERFGTIWRKPCLIGNKFI